jgi:hypothetical protein
MIQSYTCYIYALVLCLLLNHVASTFRVVKPREEWEKVGVSTTMDNEMALFGRPPYGGNLVGTMVLPPSNNFDGCKRFNWTEVAATIQQYKASIDSHSSRDDVLKEDEDAQSIKDFILLLQRGNCHFVEKVRHAQEISAIGVVIYDTSELRRSLPIMADDGSGGDIQIPSVLIHHDDASRLIQSMKTTKTIVMLNGDVPHPDNRVEYSLWLSSKTENQVLRTFIENFRFAAKELGKAVKFTPYYEVYEGDSWGCFGKELDSTYGSNCGKLCLYDEKFCTYDPEGNTTIGLDGNDVLEENLRQLCIFQYTETLDTNEAVLNDTTSSSESLYWEYLVGFNQICNVLNATKDNFNQACSEKIQKQIGIPITIIQQCVDEKGVSLLQKQANALHQNGILTIPQFTVNEVPFLGGIDCKSPLSPTTCAPLEMICAGFEDEFKRPEACGVAFWEDYCFPPKKKDACGVCLLAGSIDWNKKCSGCDGKPNSGLQIDFCGVCGGNGSFDLCGKCLQENDPTRDQSCSDCQGVPNGLTKVDACGVCDGHGSFDACGLCLDRNDPRRQNIQCHVVEDPDAVKGKADMFGIHAKQFDHQMASSFEKAIAFVCEISVDQVGIKSVTVNETSLITQVFFFVACTSEPCRLLTQKKLSDPSASLEIAMKMRSNLPDTSSGKYQLEKLHLHSISLQTEKFVSSMETTTDNSEKVIHVNDQEISFSPSSQKRSNEQKWGLFTTVFCSIGLAGIFAVFKVREEKLRREFRSMFARYTPLTTMEDEYLDENGIDDYLPANFAPFS